MAYRFCMNGLPPPETRETGDQSPPIICRMIFDELCVLANGDIVCSCADPAGLRVYGNVFRDRISAIYNGNDYRTMREWQLASRPGSWCPVIQSPCGGRVSRASSQDRSTGRTIKLLQLEPTSYCNLRCPECPVSQFEENPVYRPERIATLPLEIMLDVIDQLPDLEKLLFYNFGEPFLHPDAIQFLRTVRHKRPDVIIHTSTNGTVLRQEQIDALAQEALVDRIVFSIDGARDSSYRQYRVHGSLVKALSNLESLLNACRAAGTYNKVEIHWQYILFEWNDSLEELIETQSHAKKIGVPLKWIVTHTPGASQRITYGSPELSNLMGDIEPYTALTCELRMKDLWQNQGIPSQRYSAHLQSDHEHLNAQPGEKVSLQIIVQNTSTKVWLNEKCQLFRLGMKLQSQTGRYLRELNGILLPACIEAGQQTVIPVTLVVPEERGFYTILVDVVKEGVCWFSERGSRALTISLEVC